MATNRITVRLTNQAPVTFNDADWPILTTVQRREQYKAGSIDGTVADRVLTLTVRTPRLQYLTGQFIVYASYEVCNTVAAAPFVKNSYAGTCKVIVPQDYACDPVVGHGILRELRFYEEVVGHIQATGREMQTKPHLDADRILWPELVDACVESLPAVNLTALQPTTPDP